MSTASAGHIEANYRIACLYDQGVGVEADPKRAVEFACCSFCVFGFQYDPTVRDRSAVVAKECLRLIFVDVHYTVPLGCIGTLLA